MTQTARNELSAIQRDLTSIITELKSVESGIRRDFKGIGNDVCANRIGSVTGKLEQASRMLTNLDTTSLAPGFELRA